MSTFAYTGVSETGAPVKGVVEAFDELEAMEQARELCRVVQSVVPVREKTSILSMDIGKPRVKPKNIAILCSQFSIIMKAGMPISRAAHLVADQTNDKYLKKVVSLVAEDVSAGHGLADSFENKGEHLPRVFTETIRAGEESGHLTESFDRLHSYYDKRSKIAAKVAGALTYPIFVLIIAVVVVAVMMVMVIPAIAGLVSSLGAEMPAITQFLINTSAWVSQNILWIIIVLLLVIVGINLFRRREQGKVFFSTLQMNLPVIGPIAVYAGAASFANTMATLIAAGLPMTKAVQVTSRVMTNHVLAKDVGRMEAGLEEGKTLGECMEDCKYFPKTLVEMCSVGEQTGELEETLNTVGEFYDSETQRVTDKALSLMEPTLLVLMALFAGFIVIALYMPMFTMSASLEEHPRKGDSPLFSGKKVCDGGTHWDAIEQIEKGQFAIEERKKYEGNDQENAGRKGRLYPRRAADRGCDRHGLGGNRRADLHGGAGQSRPSCAASRHSCSQGGRSN